MTLEYSIWIVPPERQYGKLENVISKLSEQYSSPRFAPHVTLLADLRLSKRYAAKKVAELVRRLKPFKIKLNGLNYSDEYFRCLFIEIVDSDELVKANQLARIIFGREPDRKYRPHLSLMYGYFTPEVKDKIIERIGSSFIDEFHVTGVYLALSSSRIDPKKWKTVEEFFIN